MTKGIWQNSFDCNGKNIILILWDKVNLTEFLCLQWKNIIVILWDKIDMTEFLWLQWKNIVILWDKINLTEFLWLQWRYIIVILWDKFPPVINSLQLNSLTGFLQQVYKKLDQEQVYIQPKGKKKKDRNRNKDSNAGTVPGQLAASSPASLAKPPDSTGAPESSESAISALVNGAASHQASVVGRKVRRNVITLEMVNRIWIGCCMYPDSVTSDG